MARAVAPPVAEHHYWMLLPSTGADLFPPANTLTPRVRPHSPPLYTTREGLHRLTQLIFSKAQPKRLGSQILSGPMLAGLTEAYVTAINNG